MTENKQQRKKIDIDALFEDGTLIDQAINIAVKNAVERHKKLSQPIVIWRDGKVQIVDPKDIDQELTK
jgi:uncharacterized protein YdaT